MAMRRMRRRMSLFIRYRIQLYSHPQEYLIHLNNTFHRILPYIVVSVRYVCVITYDDIRIPIKL